MTETVEPQDAPGQSGNGGQTEATAAAGTAGPPPAAEVSARLLVRSSGRTAVGHVREHNEDNLVVANLTTGQIRPRDQVCEDEVGDHGLLLSVCDGMGGAAAGEVASQMAVDILVEAMRRGGPPKHRDVLARRLVQAVEEAGRRIFQAAQKERSRRGMGTTTTVAVLIDKVLFIGEVGDSRAYLLRGGQLKQVTKDQSLVNQLIEAGHLTEDEAEAFEHSNIILQALGTAESVNVDLTFIELRKGDRVMMCSDGLSGLVHADMLRATLDQVRDPAECCGKLIELAEAGGGHDNITCIVADFEGEDLAAPIEGDSFGYMQYPLPPADHDTNAFIDDETTAGGRDLNRAPTEPAPCPNDSDETTLVPPPDPELDDTRANVLWVLGGVLALAGAAGVWWTLDPTAAGRASKPPVVAAAHESKPAAVEPEQSAEVAVNIYTDVDEALLLVNGESRGPLSASQTRSLKLRPGAYRFEAQSGGTPLAVTVVTVRGDTPMDVFLKAPGVEVPPGEPSSAAEPSPGAREGAAQTARAKSQPERGEPKREPEAPVVPADAVEPAASTAPAGAQAESVRAPAASTARPRSRRVTALSPAPSAAPSPGASPAPAAPAPAPAAPAPAAAAEGVPENPF